MPNALHLDMGSPSGVRGTSSLGSPCASCGACFAELCVDLGAPPGASLSSFSPGTGGGFGAAACRGEAGVRAGRARPGVGGGPSTGLPCSRCGTARGPCAAAEGAPPQEGTGQPVAQREQALALTVVLCGLGPPEPRPLGRSCLWWKTGQWPFISRPPWPRRGNTSKETQKLPGMRTTTLQLPPPARAAICRHSCGTWTQRTRDGGQSACGCSVSPAPSGDSAVSLTFFPSEH